MVRRKSSGYHREATKEPFELELENGTVVTFKNPNTLPTENAFDLARETDPERSLRVLLGDDDWAKFWDEYRHRPVSETNALTEDVMAFYGANRPERRSSAS